ncbi:DUF72 domain-containing protein [Paenibacillus sp. sptzw28]|uniref:DUF72 domain-containing protein n=1 Tax=Paenibacillus sp. sptzw28 TaxID=715179 RepID=UPI002163D1AF|nr:DUF72 domain-containing protein [Paenibacillus sp. sptzw28]
MKDFREQLGDIPVVVEFRHEEWIDERIFELLEDEGLGYVCVDEPQFKTLVPPMPLSCTNRTAAEQKKGSSGFFVCKELKNGQKMSIF